MAARKAKAAAAAETPVPITAPAPAPAPDSITLTHAQITPDPANARRTIYEDALHELAETKGLFAEFEPIDL